MRGRLSPRSIPSLLATVGLLGSAIAIAGPANAAVRLHPLASVPITIDNVASVQVSASGNFVVALNTDEQVQHVDVASSVATLVQFTAPDFTATPGGPAFTFGPVGGNRIHKRVLQTGELEVIDMVLPPDEPGSDISSFFAGRDLFVDEQDKLVGFTASSGATGQTRPIVYDTESSAVIGDQIDSFVVDDARNASMLRMAADGSYIVTLESEVVAGGTGDRHVRWTLPSGSPRTVDSPAAVSGLLGRWNVSDDLHWSVFPSDQAGVVEGLDDTARLYRQDHRTGDVTVVPVNFSTVVSYEVRDGGRVLVLSETAGSDTEQLFSWDGVGAELQPLSVAIDGTFGDAPVEEFFTNSDATTVTFVTFADSLTDDARTAQRNVYQASLPTLKRVGKIDANDTFCTAVQGAVAGEWVSVNVTPVEAVAGGFGTLHSSDDSAGGTASVNFGEGSVDPNIAVVQVGADGQVCFTNSEHGPVHVVLDQMTVSGADSFAKPTAAGAERLVDTRSGDGGVVAASATRCVDVVGAAAGEWVSVNVTPVEAVAGGFGTLHSSDDSAGGTASVNFGEGSVDPNIAVVQVGADGQVCFTNSEHGPVHVVLDQMTVSGAGSFAKPTAAGATRLVDTREAQ